MKSATSKFTSDRSPVVNFRDLLNNSTFESRNDMQFWWFPWTASDVFCLSNPSLLEGNNNCSTCDLWLQVPSSFCFPCWLPTWGITRFWRFNCCIFFRGGDSFGGWKPLIPQTGLPVGFYLRKKQTGHAGGRAGFGWARIWPCWARWVGLGVGFGWARWLGWAWRWAWGLAVLGPLGWAWGLAVLGALAGLGVALGVGSTKVHFQSTKVYFQSTQMYFQIQKYTLKVQRYTLEVQKYTCVLSNCTKYTFKVQKYTLEVQKYTFKLHKVYF